MDEALNFLKETVKEKTPQAKIAYKGESEEYKKTNTELYIIFSLALFGFANTDDHFEVNNSFNLTDALKGVINNHKLIKATQEAIAV